MPDPLIFNRTACHNDRHVSKYPKTYSKGIYAALAFLSNKRPSFSPRRLTVYISICIWALGYEITEAVFMLGAHMLFLKLILMKLPGFGSWVHFFLLSISIFLQYMYHEFVLKIEL